MQLGQSVNIVKQLVNPKRFPVIFRKIMEKLRASPKDEVNDELIQWLADNESDFAEIAVQLDPALWEEALDYSLTLERHSQSVLNDLGVKLGGGGYYTLIYFLARHLKPKVIVETGVAAGYSSHAFLSAIERNGIGVLYSSDFPYFRLDEPEKYIGVLVPTSLRKNWHLYIDGDSVNLPKIAEQSGTVKLFHYDSDKRYSGRESALETMKDKLSEDCIIIMDDINDNRFFMDYCRLTKKPYRIFRFEGKHIGLIGDLKKID